MKTEHTPGAIRAAEIITGATHDPAQRLTQPKYETAYGRKTVEGIAAIIDNETAAPALLAALEAAVKRMEAVAESIPVHRRAKGVSQATHVAHMAGHLAQHAKIARAAIAKATGEPQPCQP